MALPNKSNEKELKEMAKNHLNAYEHYDEIDIKRKQIVYLYEIRNEAFETISEITGYAISTIRNYVKKFAHLLEDAKNLFKYSRKKIFEKKKPIVPEGIEFHCPDDFDFDDKAQRFYLIRAFDANGNRVFSKIGTTIRQMIERMKEHLNYYKKLGVVKIVVDKVWDCGERDAVMYESFFRAGYIFKHPTAFCSNDRFFDVDFDLDEAETIFKNVPAILSATFSPV